MLEFGIACVIAGLLLFVSEQYLKESLFSEINSRIALTLNTFHRTTLDLDNYKRLPDQIANRVSSTILGAPVIQKDLTYRFDFDTKTHNIGGEPALRATMISTSTYVNITDEEQQCEVRESLPAYGLNEQRNDYDFYNVESDSTDEMVFPSKHSRQVIKNYISSREDRSKLFSRLATLPPGFKLKVKFEGVAYLGVEEWIPLEAYLPTINMVCIASGDGLKFGGQPGDAVRDIWDASEDQWELRGAVMPGQVLEFWVE